MIYAVRGQKIMLDSDLAELYEVETKYLNRQVQRNANRFPLDFCFKPDSDELADLRCQFVTANPATPWNYKRRQMPNLFSENGVAMLSSVLNSDKAIEVNIAIMRIFTKLRSFLMLEKETKGRLDHLEKGTQRIFKIIFERLDSVEEKIDKKSPA